MRITGFYSPQNTGEIEVFSFVAINLLGWTYRLTDKKLIVIADKRRKTSPFELASLSRHRVDFTPGEKHQFAPCFTLNPKDDGIRDHLGKHGENNGLFFYFLWRLIFHEVRHAVQAFSFHQNAKKMYNAADVNHIKKNDGPTAEHIRRFLDPDLPIDMKRKELDANVVEMLAIIALCQSFDGTDFDDAKCRTSLTQTRRALSAETVRRIEFPNFAEMIPFPRFNFNAEIDTARPQLWQLPISL